MFRPTATSKTPAAPHFPTYLLPSLKIPFFRRRQSVTTTASPATLNEIPSLSSSPSSAASADHGPSSPASTSAGLEIYSPGPAAAQQQGSGQSAPREPTGNLLARSLPDVLRCNTCGTDIAYGLQIVSKGFTGRHGRALLVSPPLATSTPSCPGSGPASVPTPTDGGGSSPPVSPGHHAIARESANLVNVTVGRPEPRNLVTGAHVVADINCLTCGVKIGWKYVDAREQAQKYKVGKFILETERVTLLRSWEDIRPGEGEDPHRHFYSSSAPAGSLGGRRKSSTPGDRRKQSCSSEGADGDKAFVVGAEGSEAESEEEIIFDSDDEDECEDMFAGVWDAATVARRRSSKASSQDVRKGRTTNGLR